MNNHLPMTFILLFCLLSANAAHAKSKQVVFIRYPIPVSHFSTVVDGFKQTMTKRGFKEGEQVEYIDILTRSADKASVPDVMDAMAEWQDKADMIITCGWVSIYTRTKLQKTRTPQLFVPALKSVALKMLSSTTAPTETNISGIYLMYPPEKILRLARFLIPELKNYGYVYDSRIPADMIFKSAYEQLSTTKRHGITIHCLDLATGVEQVLEDLRQKNIQAFGGIIGSFQKRKELAASGLPVITSFTLDIEKEELEKYVQEGNIVAGLFNPFRYCGEQAAEMTADIFKGKTSIEQTTPRPAKQVAFINLKTANRLNLQVPFTALESVDIVIK
jgi:ABC-type uncharacterized transport system substrate-binding protein